MGNGTGRGTEPPRILHRVEPRYPESSRQAGRIGSVSCRLEISSGGIVQRVSLTSSSGDSELDSAVLQAVEKWRYVPARNRDTGNAVPCNVTQSVHFNLKKKGSG